MFSTKQSIPNLIPDLAHFHVIGLCTGFNLLHCRFLQNSIWMFNMNCKVILYSTKSVLPFVNMIHDMYDLEVVIISCYWKIIDTWILDIFVVFFGKVITFSCTRCVQNLLNLASFFSKFSTSKDHVDYFCLNWCLYVLAGYREKIPVLLFILFCACSLASNWVLQDKTVIMACWQAQWTGFHTLKGLKMKIVCLLIISPWS